MRNFGNSEVPRQHRVTSSCAAVQTMVAQPTTELVGKMYLNLAGLELLRKLGGFMLFIFVKFFFLFRPRRNKCLFSTYCLAGSLPRANKCPKSHYFLTQKSDYAGNADKTVPQSRHRRHVTPITNIHPLQALLSNHQCPTAPSGSLSPLTSTRSYRHSPSFDCPPTWYAPSIPIQKAAGPPYRENRCSMNAIYSRT